MLRLKKKREPYWLDYRDGIRVQVRPMTSAMYQAAQGAVGRMIRERSEERGEENPIKLLNETSMAEWQGHIARILARLAIVGWEGITAGDDDGIAPVSDENVDELMDLPRFCEWFQSAYVSPMGDTAQEGNVSGPGPSGTPEPGPNSAQVAANAEPTAQEAEESRTSTT